MLILFDIDATLISTSGCGMRSMIDAGADLFGPSFHATGIDFAGRLDPLIITDMFRVNAVSDTPESRRAFRETYRKHLLKRLADPATARRSLPGVAPLLDALSTHEHVTLGLVTGNFAETGSIKLRACGIDPDRFRITAWGDESPSSPPKRDDLPGVAMGRYLNTFQRPIRGEQTLVIGDTPHDIRCAKAHSCRSLAVATGSFPVDVLQSHTPDRVVSDLSATDDILNWILARPSSS